MVYAHNGYKNGLLEIFGGNIIAVRDRIGLTLTGTKESLPRNLIYVNGLIINMLIIVTLLMI